MKQFYQRKNIKVAEGYNRIDLPLDKFIENLILTKKQVEKEKGIDPEIIIYFDEYCEYAHVNCNYNVISLELIEKRINDIQNTIQNGTSELENLNNLLKQLKNESK